MIFPLFQIVLVYAHNLQVRGHETDSRTLTKTGKKAGCHSSGCKEAVFPSGAVEATPQGALLN